MSLKIFAFLLFVAAVSASPLLGEEKCLWGPSYWCQNFKQAKECDAVQHCRTKVWKVKDECDTCEQVVDFLRTFLSSNDTETEIMDFMEQLCDRAGPLAATCKQLVEEYEPAIIQTLLAVLQDSQQLCSELGLCATKDRNQIAAQLIMKSLPVKQPLRAFLAPGPVITKSKPVTQSTKCILCEFVMKELDTLISENSTQQEIEDALQEVCSLLPSTISSDCTQFVKEYASAILTILAQELDPTMVCTSLDLCTSGQSVKVEPLKFVSQGNETCDLCIALMGYLKAVLQDQETQQAILTFLKTICDELPSQLSSQCSEIVSEYGQAILSFIATADPKVLCQEFGLCQSGLTRKDNFCFLGASYWCANKQNALRCKAFTHCYTHVWKK